MPNTQTAHNAMTEAVLRVFETAAFMSMAEPQPQDDPVAACDCGATMTFDGTYHGRISLKLCRSVLPQLVENMLGMCDDDGSVTAREDDAMCESLNMICGNILTEWYGDAPVFDLHPPRALTVAEIDALHDSKSVIVHLSLENTDCVVLAELNS